MSCDSRGGGPQLRYPWQSPYLDALTETDSARLPLKISVAEKAIATRLQLPALSVDEYGAIQDALHTLRFLLNEQSEKRTGTDESEKSA
jgi:hypothetical protein